MRRFLILAGAALAMLTASIAGAGAQQPGRVQVGVLGKHRGVFQNGVELGCQPTRRHRARRPQAHKNMRAAHENGKRAGCSPPPIVGRIAAKDVDSHENATSCAAGVCRRAVHQLPSLADFAVFSEVARALAGDAVLIAPVSRKIPCKQGILQGKRQI